MPTVKRKSVPAVALPDALAALPAEQQASRQVFYLAATGEVFADYEYVLSRLTQAIRGAAFVLPPANLSVRAQRQVESHVL